MKYRKISVAIWADERFRELSDDGKLTFLYLLTHPAMTAVGAMRATPAGLAAELSWNPRRLQRALAPAVERGMLELNAAAGYIALPNFLKHNRPENPNVVRGWARSLGAIPECPEKARLIARCVAILTEPGSREAFMAAYRKEFGRAVPLNGLETVSEPLGVTVSNTGTGTNEPEPEPEPPSGGTVPPRPSMLAMDRIDRNGHGPEIPGARLVTLPRPAASAPR